jgi:hypothetical protein
MRQDNAVNHENIHYKITGHYYLANYKLCIHKVEAQVFHRLQIIRNTVKTKNHVIDKGITLILRTKQYDINKITL